MTTAPHLPRTDRASESAAVVLEPRLYVLARPSVDLAAVATFLKDEDLTWRRDSEATDAESLVEFAGRICYLSFGERQSPKTNAEYLEHLINQGHESVLEHVSWTFAIAGVSRAFSHQLVRHRVGFSFSQLSQQYHDESDAQTVMPRAVAAVPSAAAKWISAVERARSSYTEILDALEAVGDPMPTRERLRLIRSAARSVLLTATETKLVFTANARSVRHFLTVRGSLEGDEEMRIVSARLLEAVNQDAPRLFTDFEVQQLTDGLPLVVMRSD